MGGILIKNQILDRILNDNLIIKYQIDHSCNPKVETASYDLSVGSIVWKDSKSNNVKVLHYNEQLDIDQQKYATLQPGQMMFVVTREEVNMPLNLSATVFSRNKLSRDGILALNAGHIDPGYRGPITIRLINLRATTYTIKLGIPIYTIVFQELSKEVDEKERHPPISREETIKKVTASVDEALSNALYDLALLNNFVKKDEFGRSYWKWIKGSISGIIVFLLSLLGLAVTLNRIWEISGVKAFLKEMVK
jgi:deoxycytidine triphosphate deaminase